MEKILSIIVPTYNMETLLPRCLDSFIIDEESMSQIEIIVVNDGSTDLSSKIAHQYSNRYPNTYIVVDKPNANYGSCINAALKVATGKYLRICDADDCYENDNLVEYIHFLSTINTDIVYSSFETYCGDKLQSIIQVPESFCNEQFYLDDLQWDRLELLKLRAMHSMAVKRYIFIDNNYYQTEGISYTDTQFVFFSLLYSTNCSFFNKVIYKYYLGRDGQTMSKTSIIKSYKHFFENAKRMTEEYVNYEGIISENKAVLLDMSISVCLFYYIRTIILHLPYQRDNIDIFNELLSTLERSSKLNGIQTILMKSKFYRLWKKYHISPRLIQIIGRCLNI